MAEFLLIIMAYVIGSVPFGYVLATTFYNIDPRKAGSCSVGATNVARLCGPVLGVATLTCDILKGILPVLLAGYVHDNAFFITLVALAAVLGHVFSCFLGFKGGKAVATSIGVFIVLGFWQLLFSAIICIIIIWRSGFVSLGSLALVTLLPAFLLLSGTWDYFILAFCIMVLIYWTHRENIIRLARGKEKPWLKKG